MSKKLMVLGFALLVFGGMAWAGDKAWTGVVSDSHCQAKHSTAGADAAACVEKCVAGGAKYVLVSRGKVYQVEPQDKFQGMGGKRVKVTGTLSGESITAESVEEAAAHKKAGAKGDI